MKSKYLETTLSLDDLAQKEEEYTEISSVIPSNAEDIDTVISYYKIIANKWGWFSRLQWSFEEWSNHILDNTTYFRFIVNNYNKIGFLELKRISRDVGLIKYVALLDEFIGLGYGKQTIFLIKKMAKENALNKLLVQTRDTDHPNALKSYLKAGFVILKQEELTFEK
ncbi:GNAT family N-acetyltransferase [Methanosarcina sp.]|uniref:GNAT family N-acetyltransferase n=1 Tax=Methanosarcina sp. TaxID=2213 RepID=UPI003BB60877